uniref:Uncharacterized protein n=1 Tax=viral metagenome TaxID=1070528 RepID=A0A6C0B4T1_9ZZZZ
MTNIVALATDVGQNLGAANTPLRIKCIVAFTDPGIFPRVLAMLATNTSLRNLLAGGHTTRHIETPINGQKIIWSYQRKRFQFFGQENFITKKLIDVKLKIRNQSTT